MIYKWGHDSAVDSNNDVADCDVAKCDTADRDSVQQYAMCKCDGDWLFIFWIVAFGVDRFLFPFPYSPLPCLMIGTIC